MRDDCCCEEGFHSNGVDFSTFIISLGTSVLYHLGAVADPGSGQESVNLPMARHVIDSISMLQAKTAGNLDDEEKRLIEALLFDLRLKFVEACKTSQGQASEGSDKKDE